MGLTFQTILDKLKKSSFAVLTTVDGQGSPHSVGVEYGVAADGKAIYVMTRRHLKKVRNIALNPKVAFVVPLQRRLLWFVPPPCIQFRGTAEILDRTDSQGIRTFKSFFMGRRILKQYEEFESRGETRVCFLKITPEPVISTYMVGHSIWELIGRMEVGAEEVTIPVEFR